MNGKHYEALLVLETEIRKKIRTIFQIPPYTTDSDKVERYQLHYKEYIS